MKYLGIIGVVIMTLVFTMSIVPNVEAARKNEPVDPSIEIKNVKNVAKVGQTIKITGKVSIDTDPTQLIVKIKDHDFMDIDDTLSSTTVDSNGRFTTTWTVRDTDSNDRQYSTLFLAFLDPTFALLSDANDLVNGVESNTVEIYAEVYTPNGKITTCDEKTGITSWDYCRNNTLKIDDRNWKNTESESDSFWDYIDWFIF